MESDLRSENNTHNICGYIAVWYVTNEASRLLSLSHLILKLLHIHSMELYCICHFAFNQQNNHTVVIIGNEEVESDLHSENMKHKFFWGR